MAYNSDGYIMIDFTEVDFRRTNQTIEGLYKRCVDVIGTNKFILVINANGRTPLPATCSFTNNQYVIDTVIYMFAVSSNDNLFIRRNDVPASDIIDDSSISVDKTWSSNKIDSELDSKADASALADYQPLLTAISPVSINADSEISVDLSSKQNVLTPVSPVSINAENEISVDLSGKQDTLTAGDNISIVDNVISAVGIKTFTYMGNGQTTNNIIFPELPKYIFNITGYFNGSDYATNFIGWGVQQHCSIMATSDGSFGNANAILSFDDNNKTMTLTATNTSRALNVSDVIYTVYYI